MSDVVERAKAALEETNCLDDMQDFFRVGLVRELVAEVERLRSELFSERATEADRIVQMRATIERVQAIADRAAEMQPWTDSDGPSCDTAQGFNEVGNDILAALEADR